MGKRFDIISSSEGYDFFVMHDDKEILYTKECLNIVEWIKRKIASDEDLVTKPPGFIFYDGESVFFRLLEKELGVSLIGDCKGEVSYILVPEGLTFKDVDRVLSYKSVVKFLKNLYESGYYLKRNKDGSYS